ncbi:unnamed protein product [Absidia cylindrospora]
MDSNSVVDPPTGHTLDGATYTYPHTHTHPLSLSLQVIIPSTTAAGGRFDHDPSTYCIADAQASNTFVSRQYLHHTHHITTTIYQLIGTTRLYLEAFTELGPPSLARWKNTHHPYLKDITVQLATRRSTLNGYTKY